MSKSASPPAKVYFQPFVVSPAASHLRSMICSAVFAARARPRLICVAQSLPLEASRCAQTDQMKADDKCVVGVCRDRELDLRPVAEFIQVSNLLGCSALICGRSVGRLQEGPECR